MNNHLSVAQKPASRHEKILVYACWEGILIEFNSKATHLESCFHHKIIPVEKLHLHLQTCGNRLFDVCEHVSHKKKFLKIWMRYHMNEKGVEEMYHQTWGCTLDYKHSIAMYIWYVYRGWKSIEHFCKQAQDIGSGETQAIKVDMSGGWSDVCIEYILRQGRERSVSNQSYYYIGPHQFLSKYAKTHCHPSWLHHISV